MPETTYTTMDANKGERTVLLVGFEVKAVFIGADHEELAKRCAELLNGSNVEEPANVN